VFYPKAINKVLGRTVEHRTIRYLNNSLERDHRGIIKQRIKPMLSFKSPVSAARFAGAFDGMRNYFRVRALRNVSVHLIRFTYLILELRREEGGSYCASYKRICNSVILIIIYSFLFIYFPNLY